MNPGQTLQFKITSIKQETPLAKTYQLELEEGTEFNFKPGQFLTFIIRTEKQELRRSYSILSIPGEPLKITVKKVDNGSISRYILQNWKEGDLVYSLPPAGRFFVAPQQTFKRDIFCFAAGSGIVPILPQIRHLLKLEPQSVIHLIYSNRNEEDALFLSYIESLAAEQAALNIINLFSEPLQRLANRGRLSNISAELLIEQYLRFEKEHSIFLLCGPFAYMRMLGFTIGLMHFPKENILRENFLPNVMRSTQASRSHYPETTIEIIINAQSHMVPVLSGENILDAGLKQGLPLPYSCKGGVCSSCVAICKSGEVHLDINEALSESDINEGWILTCTGYPKTNNVKVEFI